MSCSETLLSHRETTRACLSVSTYISHHETEISLQLAGVDHLGRVLLQRVLDLLATRSDLNRAEFGTRIKRGHSWISEFLAGLRTTNDLRLVMKIARVFGVPVAHLIGEPDPTLDAGAATLLATWRALRLPEDRALLLKTATAIRERAAPDGVQDEARPDDEREPSANRRPKSDESPRRKR